MCVDCDRNPRYAAYTAVISVVIRRAATIMEEMER